MVFHIYAIFCILVVVTANTSLFNMSFRLQAASANDTQSDLTNKQVTRLAFVCIAYVPSLDQ